MRIAIHSLDEDESKQTLTNYTAGIISFMYIVNQASMIKFDIFHILAENSVISVICFFWNLLQAAKIWNSSKNTHVQAG